MLKPPVGDPERSEVARSEEGADTRFPQLRRIQYADHSVMISDVDTWI